MGKVDTKVARTKFVRNIRRSLKTFWQIAPLSMCLYLGVALVQVAASLSEVWLIGRVLNRLTDVVVRHNGNGRMVVGLAIALGVVTIVEQLAWVLLRYFERQAYQVWSVHNYFTFLQRSSLLDLGQFDDPDTKDLINRLDQGGYAWKPVNFAFSILYLFHSLARMVSTFVILASLAPVLIIVLLLANLPAVWVQKREADLSWGIWSQKGKDSHLFWALSALFRYRETMTEIKPQGSRMYLLGKAETAFRSYLDGQRSILRRFLGSSLAAQILEGSVLGGINVWLIAKVVASKGAFTIGQYSIYSGITMQFQNSSSMVYKNIADLLDVNNYMTDLYTFLDMPRQLPMPTNPIRISRKAMPSVEFKDVSFKYPSAEHYVFRKLNFKLSPGEHLAIVGQNGAGKSTLIKLLLRFYDVTQGQILVDGHDIREIMLDDWYFHVGALFQGFNHYPLSFDENITIGRPGARDNGKLETAIEQSTAASVLEKLKFGGDTILDPSFENGSELSGGEWQKVALARAFYRDANLLILDEPTSAVDAKAEYGIFEQIHRKQASKTTLIVSHRFSTVRQAERIIVLAKGKLVEDGSHQELMDQRGLYYEMFEKQAEGYR
jgi:ATP-binding cassette subfamily B protein